MQHSTAECTSASVKYEVIHEFAVLVQGLSTHAGRTPVHRYYVITIDKLLSLFYNRTQLQKHIIIIFNITNILLILLEKFWHRHQRLITDEKLQTIVIFQIKILKKLQVDK